MLHIYLHLTHLLSACCQQINYFQNKKGQGSYKFLALFFALLAFLVSPAFSQNDTTSALEEIVVTSHRIPVPQRQIAMSVSIFTEADINARGNLVLTDVLRQMPGVATTNNGGLGKATALRVRGEEGFRTLIILDGIRLQDPSGPQIGSQMEHLLSNDIGRIELLRGPQGLSYGADAGGIVNISSVQLEDGINGLLSADVGSFGSQLTNGNFAAKNKQLDFFLSATELENEGFNSRVSDSDLADADGYDNTTIHTRLGYRVTEQLKFNFVHRNIQGDSEFDGCYSVGIVHDCRSDYKLKASRLMLNYVADNFSHELAYARTDSDRQSFALDAPSFTTKGSINRLEYTGSATNLSNFDLVFGLDVEQTKNNNTRRDNKGAYLEYLSDFSEALYITAGIRYDDNDDFGANTSYRLTAAYLIPLQGDNTLKFRGSYGTGFRAPSPYEVAYNGGPFSYAPAAMVSLRQEESLGFELGLEYLLNNGLDLQAIYFDQEIENAITFDLASFSGYLQDVGTSASKGVELLAALPVNSNWHVNANYTYNSTKRPNGLQRLRRPKHLMNLGLSYAGLNDKFKLNAFYRISKGSIDESIGSIVNLDDFRVLDLNAHFNLTDRFLLSARVENLLDEEYQEINDYNTAERAVYIGFKLRFSAL